jgi:nitroreductase
MALHRRRGAGDLTSPRRDHDDRPLHRRAAFAIVVVVKKESPYAVSDTSRAIQNMVLTAWADGVGSNWTGFGPLPAVEKLLGVPETHEGLAVVPFGVPNTTLGRGRKKRKPMTKIVSRERFGTPFS